MKGAKKLLELLTQEFPVSGSVAHNITLRTSKMAECPEAPAEPRVLITLWFAAPNSGGCWTSDCFYLTDEDYDKTPEQIVTDIKQVIADLKLIENPRNIAPPLEGEAKFQDDIRSSLGY